MRNDWTKSEIAWFRENYPKHGLHYCSDILKRTTSAILMKAHLLGLKRRGKGRKDRVYTYDGYITVSSEGDRYQVHRRVMENHIGRKLSTKELVHHKDGNRKNNSIENLEILSRSEHMKIHYPQRMRNSKGQFA